LKVKHQKHKTNDEKEIKNHKNLCEKAFRENQFDGEISEIWRNAFLEPQISVLQLVLREEKNE